MSGMGWLGGHLGAAVSALVDGQLDEDSAERAWAHVAGCASCRRLVEREGWVKRRLAELAAAEVATPRPPSHLLGALYDLEPGVAVHGAAAQHAAATAAWAAVDRLERRDRSRRRAGLAAAGVGSVSVAVLGLGALGAAPLDIGGTPTPPPASVLTRVSPSGSQAPTSAGASVAPTTGPFGSWQLRSRASVVERPQP